MRYKLLGLVAVLLISTPPAIFSQQMSPIIVETGPPVPSVVKSGEPFRITYKVKYTDAVVVLEDYMRLDSLALVAPESEEKPDAKNVSAAKAEVLNVEIGEVVRDGSDEKGFINVQNFIYTFIIIGDHGEYKVPSFDFVWVEKEAGATVAEVKEARELQKFPTDEAGVVYVSTIVRPPTPFIREGIRFDSLAVFAQRAPMLAYGVIMFFSAIAFVVVVRFFRQPAVPESETAADDIGTEDPPAAYEGTPVLPARKARRKFLRELKMLERKVNTSSFSGKETVENLYSLVRTLILSELAQGPVRAYDSDSPSRICKQLESFSDKQKKQLGRKYGVSIELAGRLKNYYENIESGAGGFENPEKEIRSLKSVVENIDLRMRVSSKVRSFAGRMYLLAKDFVTRR